MATQRRFSIGFFTSFPEALEAKTKLLLENPNNTYQIRRKRSNFDLMQRVTSSVAEQVIDRAQKLYTKKGKKKRVKDYKG